MKLEEIQHISKRIQDNLGKVIIGKSDVIELMLTSLLARGHILLEDVPGTGKTMLAKSLAKSINVEFNRIQFTPDLLPSDITGLNYYNQKEGDFTYRKGPVFANILLADEINRATPRTQSSLLECMEERQVTVDGVTRKLDDPFLVIATQNPIETAGTFPLPEAQLDRFMMQLNMGFPDYDEEIAILNRFMNNDPIASLEPVCEKESLISMQNLVPTIFVHSSVMDYLVQIVMKTRSHKELAQGVSPRASLAFLRASQALAAIRGKSYVTPEIVKYLAPYILSHRLILHNSYQQGNISKQIINDILSQVPVPTEKFSV